MGNFISKLSGSSRVKTCAPCINDSESESSLEFSWEFDEQSHVNDHRVPIFEETAPVTIDTLDNADKSDLIYFGKFVECRDSSAFFIGEQRSKDRTFITDLDAPFYDSNGNILGLVQEVLGNADLPCFVCKYKPEDIEKLSFTPNAKIYIRKKDKVLVKQLISESKKYDDGEGSEDFWSEEDIPVSKQRKL